MCIICLTVAVYGMSNELDSKPYKPMEERVEACTKYLPRWVSNNEASM